MKNYIVQTGTGDAFNAASKARQDAEIIAHRLGFEPFVFTGGRTADGALLGALKLAWNGFANWKRLIRETEPQSQILIQYPHYPVKSAVLMKRAIQWGRRQKNLQFTALIHDLDSLRGLHGQGAIYSDAQVLPLFDHIICHNEQMRLYLVRQGIPADKIIPLNIFDYLTEAETGPHRLGDGIAVAGNLSPEKSGYIRHLMDLHLPIHLYGKGLEKTSLPSNVIWHGPVPPDELPGVIEGAFGLVWDGSSGGTCDGAAGCYLQYNNPHKLSLYLASRMPVIIWAQAAEAEFVQKNNIGLTAGSLADVEAAVQSLSEEQYYRMAANAEKVGAELIQGQSLARALRKCFLI